LQEHPPIPTTPCIITKQNPLTNKPYSIITIVRENVRISLEFGKRERKRERRSVPEREEGKGGNGDGSGHRRQESDGKFVGCRLI